MSANGMAGNEEGKAQDTWDGHRWYEVTWGGLGWHGWAAGSDLYMSIRNKRHDKSKTRQS